MKMKKEYENSLEVLRNEFALRATFKRAPLNPHWGEDSADKFNFLIVLESTNTAHSFYFSQGYREPLNYPYVGRRTMAEMRQEKDRLSVKNSYPDLFALLACLCMDAGVLDCDSFEEWCSDYGYDSDSRKALKTYEACVEQSTKFKALVDVDKVWSYLEENELN